MKAVLTVLGKDKPGIIAGVSNMLADCGINIEDISQTIMQGCFTMIMLVNLGAYNGTFLELVNKAEALGKEIGVKIIVQHEDVFNAMHRV